MKEKYDTKWSCEHKFYKKYHFDSNPYDCMTPVQSFVNKVVSKESTHGYILRTGW